jgi:UDP-glucose 4-epimerase
MDSAMKADVKDSDISMAFYRPPGEGEGAGGVPSGCAHRAVEQPILFAQPPREEEVDQLDRRRSVLVLGAGLLGSHVTRALLSDGLSVHLLTRSEPRPELASLIEGAEVHIGDVGNPQALAAALRVAGHVVYSVGCPSPAQSSADPASDAGQTLIPVISTLEALRSRPDVGITFFSSGGTVYGEAGAGALREEAPLHPMNSYGLWGIPSTILRAANAYGPGQSAFSGQGAVGRFLHCAHQGLPVTLYGDGSVVRDYVYVGDIADAVARLLRAGTAPPVLNLGTGIGTSLNELLDLVMAVSGTSLTIVRHPSRGFDVHRNVLDISRLQSAIQYRPIELLQGLGMTWESVAGVRQASALVDGA